MKRKRHTIAPLRYLGTNNIAGMKWCHQKFIFRARANEEMFRQVYQEDCRRLGEGLTVEELNSRLRQVDRAVVRLSGGKAAVVRKENGKLTPEELQEITNSFEDAIRHEPKISAHFDAVEGIGIELLDAFVTTPQGQRGLLAQYEHGEQLPILRYHFPWKEYVIEAQPDGIAPAYCYEFKLIGERFWYRFEKPVAVAQACLYSYFFQRKRYKADIYIEDEARTETEEGELEPKWVEDLLNTMSGLLQGLVKPIPPNRVKCPSCEFSEECPIRQM
ncbi:MAG: hypothetical protein WBF66_00080 [Dehalococcoidia bacterium]